MVQAGGSALQPSINHRSRKIWHSTSWHTSKGQKKTSPSSFHRCSSRILLHRHQPGHSGWQGAMPFGSKDKSLGKKSSLLLLKPRIPCFLALPKAVQCTEIVVTCDCSPPPRYPPARHGAHASAASCRASCPPGQARHIEQLEVLGRGAEQDNTI